MDSYRLRKPAGIGSRAAGVRSAQFSGPYRFVSRRSFFPVVPRPAPVSGRPGVTSVFFRPCQNYRYEYSKPGVEQHKGAFCLMSDTNSTDTTSPRPAGRARRWRRRSKALAALGGIVVAGGTAYAATSWVVGLSSGSNGSAQSAAVTNLSVGAVATPAAGNLLYPGGSGDVVVSINNPNSFPVTITALSLPTNQTFAAGYSNSALTTAQTGCSASASAVIWTGSTSTSGQSKTLATPLVVAANSPLTVTLTNEATMTTAAPVACEATYFSMPSLSGVTASAGGIGSPTAGPATDSWTS